MGLSFLQFTNMNSMRNLFITGVALFLGLSIPEYFREYTIMARHGPAHTRAGWVSVFFDLYLITIYLKFSIICKVNFFAPSNYASESGRSKYASSASVCGCLCLIQYFSITYHSLVLQFNDFLNTIFFSSPTVALIVAVFLDNTLDYKDSAKDRGMPWWAKFRTFKGDSRNEEFYTLPFNLNRFFPPS